MTYEHKQLATDLLIPYVNNSRTHSDDQVLQIASSIKEFGFTNPILIDEDNGVIAGHGRIMAAKKLNLETVPCIVMAGLTEAQKKAYVIADNQLALNSEWDIDKLKLEVATLDDLDFNVDLLGFDNDFLESLREEPELLNEGLIEDDHVPEPPEEPVTKLGDVWLLGEHRLMCGDSTSIDSVKKLMYGKKADMVFTDPPYGMSKKEILNDNLNNDGLLEFNRQWIPICFDISSDCASFYVWGLDQSLLDIYSDILRPYIRNSEATFRNLLTWDKKSIPGQTSDSLRMYAPAEEKCLFFMKGVQGFNTNSDNYFEGWEPIRDYLLKSRLDMGWDVPTMKRIVGHSDLSRDHWTSKSQFSLPTKEVYNKMKAEADRLRGETGNDAFKKEYDEIKKEYDDTRSFFDATHDNMRSVWEFDRVKGDDRAICGGHDSPKPILLCERAIKTSSMKGDNILDIFGGSGSTLIACEKINRKCFMMELSEKYCDVIINRWQEFTGKQAILESNNQTYEDLKNDSQKQSTD